MLARAASCRASSDRAAWTSPAPSGRRMSLAVGGVYRLRVSFPRWRFRLCFLSVLDVPSSEILYVRHPPRVDDLRSRLHLCRQAGTVQPWGERSSAAIGRQGARRKSTAMARPLHNRQESSCVSAASTLARISCTPRCSTCPRAGDCYLRTACGRRRPLGGWRDMSRPASPSIRLPGRTAASWPIPSIGLGMRSI
jgi:hypothetical protein